MNKTAMAALAVMTFAPAPVMARDYSVGDLTIDHPVSYETPVTAQTAAGYMMITNAGEVDDRLLEVRADFRRVEVHEIVEVDGMMSMRQLEDGLVIPAGESVMLQPGGNHVMFMGLGGDPFEVGEEIPAVLVFEQAGEIEIVFNVEERTGTEGEHAHGEMDHDDHDKTEGDDG